MASQQIPARLIGNEPKLQVFEELDAPVESFRRFSYGLFHSRLHPQHGDTIFRFSDGRKEYVWSMFFSILAAAPGRPPIPLSHFGVFDKSRCQGENCDHAHHRKVYDVPDGKERDVERIRLLSYPTYMSHTTWLTLLHIAEKGESATSGSLPDFKIVLVKEDDIDRRKRVTPNPKSISDNKKSASEIVSKVPLAKRGDRNASLNPRNSLKLKVPTRKASPVSAKPQAEPSVRAADATNPPVYTASVIEKSEFHCHRFVLYGRIRYYKYLKSRIPYADTLLSVSKLPWPTITSFALEVIIHYAYNPVSLNSIVIKDEDLSLYIDTTCAKYMKQKKRCDENLLREKLSTAINQLVELWRAADYLMIEVLSTYCSRMLLNLAHIKESCNGSFCSFVLPKILQVISYDDAPRCFDILKHWITYQLARSPGQLWKRTLILCPDEVLANLVLVVRRNKLDELLLLDDKVGKEVQAERCWDFYATFVNLQSNIHSTASPKICARWDNHLLSPLIEATVHKIASFFDMKCIHQRFVGMAGGITLIPQGLAERVEAKKPTLVESVSFGRSNVVKLLEYLTVTAPQLADPPFDRAVLTYNTVLQIYSGLSKLKIALPEDSELQEADKLVLNYLKREWLNMSLGGGKFMANNRSMFSILTSEEVLEISRRLRVPVDDLLAKGAQRKELKDEHTRVADKWKEKEKRKEAAVARIAAKTAALKISQNRSRKGRVAELGSHVNESQPSHTNLEAGIPRSSLRASAQSFTPASSQDTNDDPIKLHKA